MASDRFLIGYTDNNSGYQTNVKPWLTSDNAFARLENCYVFRGRVRKRFGSTFMGENQLSSRLRVFVGTTDGSGDDSGTVPGTVFAVGQMFSVGEDIFTVNALGTPATTLSTNVLASMTYDTTTGAYTVTNSEVSENVYFYPATPVMGLTQYIVPGSLPDTLAFDTQFSYNFNISDNAWEVISSGDAVWSGSDSDFFWCTNYQGTNASINYLWATNNVPDDGIRYYDGTTWTQPVINYTIGTVIATTDGSGNASGTVAGGTGFIGQIFTLLSGGIATVFTVIASSGAMSVSTGGTGTGTFNTSTGAYTISSSYTNTQVYFSGDNQILTSLLVVQFKNRLLLFNTTEDVDGTPNNFFNRVRYSAIGNALTSFAFTTLPGQGGAIDAPIQEEIVTAQFIKDRLIVYFAASTFELAYTGNQFSPFVWQKINTELGAESTFSEIPFDRQVLGIDNTGVHACNGANVERIDQQIPQITFSFYNLSDGPKRVIGIRDYYSETVYWTFPSYNRTSSFYFPDQMLIFNYVNRSWSIFNDSVTFFGYFNTNSDTPGSTWGNTTTPWQEMTQLWSSNTSAQSNTQFKSVIAGNQEGFVGIIQQSVTSNSPMLQVTDVSSYSDGIMTIQCINHNLLQNDFILLSEMTGITFTDTDGKVLPTAIAQVTTDTLNSGSSNVFECVLLDNNLNAMLISGTYLGGGLIARVSQIDILTKQYNFYTGEDRSIYVSKVDFLVDATQIGEVTVNFLRSSSPSTALSGSLTDSGLGTNTLETFPYPLVTFEQFQTRLWHPLYFYAEGECVQFEINMSSDQMFSYEIQDDGTPLYVAQQDFQLNAMAIYTQRTSARMQ